MAIAVGYFYDLTLLSGRVIYINAKNPFWQHQNG
uniref:Uncharacterized protein n=1 Tax=Siphoviridae sp. ctMAv2 TaxID=2826258 RepID=A0A8S5LT01_9CAUD|nr:MAG TPA: hypothetical protein [Siphoviridae sp. ctMAv2]